MVKNGAQHASNADYMPESRLLNPFTQLNFLREFCVVLGPSFMLEHQIGIFGYHFKGPVIIYGWGGGRRKKWGGGYEFFFDGQRLG